MKNISLYIIMASLLLSSCNRKETTIADRKDVVDVVFANGYVEYSDEYWATANAEGFIIQSSVKEGDKVILNQSLYELSSNVQSIQANNALVNYQDALSKANPNSPQIAQINNQIEQTKAALELDKKNHERNTNLVKTQAISQLDFEKSKLQYETSKINLNNLEKSLLDLKSSLNISVKNAKNQLAIEQNNFDEYNIKSMIDGFVLEVVKNKGELVKKGETIARIGGGNLITKLYVAEEDINKIEIGQKVELALNTEKDKTYSAKVSEIYPAFDIQEQSFVIEVAFLDTTPILRSGTQVQANIIVGEQKNALIIPKKYLIQGDKVLTSNSEEIKVKVGIRNAEWIQIVEGIDENTELVLPNNK